MKRVKRSEFAGLLCVAALLISADLRGQQFGDRITAAQEALIDGVGAIGTPGVPGPIAVYGPDAFPVVTVNSGGRPAPVVAGAFAKKGRVVMFGHGGYFGMKDFDTPRLLANAVVWAAGKTKGRPRIGLRVRLQEDLSEIGDTLPLGGDWLDRLDEVDVVLTGADNLSGEKLEKLRKFVERGGGLVTAELGWGWRQLNPQKDLITEHGGNLLAHRWGYAWTRHHIDIPEAKKIVVKGPAAPEVHAGHALTLLLAESKGKTKLQADVRRTAVGAVTLALIELPPDDVHLLPRLDRLRARGSVDTVPTAKRPLTDKEGLARVLLSAEIRRNQTLPTEEIRAHPAAAVFPGAVPKKAPRGERTVAIDASIPGWRSSGLYVPPGEPVVVILPAGAEKAGLRLRIGAHKDLLWNKKAWRRAPQITREYPADTAETPIAGAFGGLLYLVVPRESSLGTMEITVKGAVDAPRYILGETTHEDWREIRDYPAPWAELECPDLTITIPSSHVRALDDPEALMTWWQETMEAYTDLAALDLTGGRRRPERFVADEQISAGYMHAGYPIMTHLDAGPRFVNLERLSTQGDWGMYHELGHNHQHRDWTFSGTGEVTCNIFSLYMMETRSGVVGGHKAMAPEAIADRKAKYVEGGRDFNTWKKDPFLALILYHEIKAAFGWKAYQKVFEEYRTLPKAERPKNDAEKRDQWLVRMSRTVGRDLGPFFESWGIPVTEKARKSIQDLPDWMPGKD